MRSIRRILFVLLFLVLFSIASQSIASDVSKVDPARYQHFVDLLKELYDLQDPAFSKWEMNRTHRMYEILVELRTLKTEGFVLPKTDRFLRTLNRLVENMHAHCLVLSCAANPGTVLLRCGKTPQNLEFGGILARKVSDFDMTVVGRKAADARDLQLNLLRKMYGEEFVEMTMTDLALADSTLAAWTIPDMQKAFSSAALNPELHRTYSGIQFVEDYVLKIGEISYLNDKGELITLNIDTFKGATTAEKREKFIAMANRAFEKSGHKIRFGKRYTDFCLGLVSDISNQMWMNLEKEAFKNNPQDVVKKYLTRYVDEVESRMGIDITKNTASSEAYHELEDLIRKCGDKEPGALDLLKKKMGDFEASIRSVVAEKQAALYAEALAAGNKERVAAILLDTKGAMTNFEVLHQSIPTGSLGDLGRVAAEELKTHPLGAPAGILRRAVKRVSAVVFNYASMKKFLAENKGAIFLQVGASLYILYDALEREEAGERGAFVSAAKQEAQDGLMFTAVPLMLEYFGCTAAAGSICLAGGVLGLAELGYMGYQHYLYQSLREAEVEPKILARLAGITPEGKAIIGKDIISELGVPLTEEDLAAPSKQAVGSFDDGKLHIYRREDGNFVFERLSPNLEKSWAANQYLIYYNWDKPDLLPVELQHAWEQWTLTPAQIIAERRLNRVFEVLRREYVKRFPQPNSEKIAMIDTEGLKLPYQLDSPLRFKNPVYKEEIFFYWKKYNEAFVRGSVQFNDDTSVYRTVGYDLEHDLAESSIRHFLEKMAELAALSDAAREAYEKAGAAELQMFLLAGVSPHFDGRDIPPEAIRRKLESIRKQSLARAEEKREAWIGYLKKTWVPVDFPDQGEEKCRILSVNVVPDKPDTCRIVCTYEINKDFSVSFQEWQRASDGKLYKNRTESRDTHSETSPGPSGPIRGTVEFRITRNDEGEAKAYFIKATDWGGDEVYGQTGDIVIPGILKTWVLESATRLEGPVRFHDDDKSWKFLKDFQCVLEDARVRLMCREEDYREHSRKWVNTEYRFGPLPKVLTKGKPAGFWFWSGVTKGALDGSFLSPTQVKAFFHVVDKNYPNPNPSWIDGYSLRRTSAANLEKARELGFAPPPPLAGENAESGARLMLIDDRFERQGDVVRLRLRVKVEFVEEPLLFEWVYRQAEPLEPGSMANGGALAGGVVTSADPARLDARDPDDRPFSEEDFVEDDAGESSFDEEDFVENDTGEPGFHEDDFVEDEGIESPFSEEDFIEDDSGDPSFSEEDFVEDDSGDPSFSEDDFVDTGTGNPSFSEEDFIEAETPPPPNPWTAALERARQWNVIENPDAVIETDEAGLTYERILASPTPWAFPRVREIMDEWIRLAKPPIEDGLPWHYTEWGVLENGVNVIAVRPDNQGKTRHQFLWENCQRLTSAEHLTLGEYIRLRLTGKTLPPEKGKEKENAGAPPPGADRGKKTSDSSSPAMEKGKKKGRSDTKRRIRR